MKEGKKKEKRAHTKYSQGTDTCLQIHILQYYLSQYENAYLIPSIYIRFAANRNLKFLTISWKENLNFTFFVMQYKLGKFSYVLQGPCTL